MLSHATLHLLAAAGLALGAHDDFAFVKPSSYIVEYKQVCSASDLPHALES